MRSRRRGIPAVVALVALLTACGGDFDANAYCGEVQRARQPADLLDDDAAVRDYLAHVRTLQDLARGDAREDWETIGDGLDSLMRDGKVDESRLKQAQERLTDMAAAADRLDDSVRADCGFGLSGT